MIRNTFLCFVCLFSCTASLFAQQYFCNAGVRPDSFLDWSKLPPSPPSSTSQFTATIPVAGASGLTATITINAVPHTQLYTLIGNSVLQVNAAQGNMTIAFSSPIKGISLTADTFGRFGHQFTMQAQSATPPIASPGPQTFTNSSAGTDPTPPAYRATPLQIEEDRPDIKAVTFTFQGADSEYFFFSLDNVRIQTGSEDNSTVVPKDGLVQWLRADQPGALETQTMFTWADQSGHGSSATQDAQSAFPAFIPQDGPNCKPALRFNGQSFLKFQLPINGLDGMSAFLVARANDDTSDGPFHSQHAALFWVENALWGNTYVSPFQTHAAYRFGTTQVGNDPEVGRRLDVASDFTLTTAIHDHSTDSLFVNGRLADTQTGREDALNGMSGEGFVGLGSEDTYFVGEISEILVYNRALSAEERARVEGYLSAKYGVK